MGKAFRKFIHALPTWGCITTGLLYAAIGIIALLSFFRLKDGGADEGSLFVFLKHFLLGRIAIWLIMSGMVAYIVWRIYEAIRDPYGYGSDLWGRGRRIVIGFSSIADALIAIAAVRVLVGAGNVQEDGQPVSERAAVRDVLENGWGDWVIISAGIIVCITALVQVVYAVNHSFRERLDVDHLARWKIRFIDILAWAGHIARGIIIGIMGFFLIKAGFTDDAGAVVNTDKAFDFIGDEVGHFYFILVAAGTLCYGAFMIAFGVYYDVDKDPRDEKQPSAW